MASLPYPRSPLNYLPTEVSGGEVPPTDCTDAHRSFWQRIFSHGLHGCTQIRRVWHPAIPTQPTKLSSHRSFWQRRASHRIHRIFWRKIFSHGLHGYTQIRRVWHPCHTHAATKLSSHRSHRTLRSLTIRGHL